MTSEQVSQLAQIQAQLADAVRRVAEAGSRMVKHADAEAAREWRIKLAEDFRKDCDDD